MGHYHMDLMFLWHDNWVAFPLVICFQYELQPLASLDISDVMTYSEDRRLHICIDELEDQYDDVVDAHKMLAAFIAQESQTSSGMHEVNKCSQAYFCLVKVCQMLWWAKQLIKSVFVIFPNCVRYSKCHQVSSISCC